MILPRVIPVLLLKGKGLVKGVHFKDHTYVGDPINAVQIFNSKEVDELLFLDISATQEKRLPPLDLIQRIADQCQMPFGVGGGVKSADDAKKILAVGAEKVCLATAAIESPQVIKEISERFGAQSVVVSVDVKKNFWGQTKICKNNGTSSTNLDLVAWCQELESLGAGEIVINNIDRDGTSKGYDLELIKKVTAAVRIPVIAVGGAGGAADLQSVISQGGASAAGAGSLFVFHGKRRAVLINFPSPSELESIRG